jgi:hypothetical protein
MRIIISILFFFAVFFTVPSSAEEFNSASGGSMPRLQYEKGVQFSKEIPAAPDMVLGTGQLGSEEMSASLVSANPDVNPFFAKNFADLYIREAAAEGVNHDVAFTQMCFETDFLKFGKIVTMDTNNFGGIGAQSGEKNGEHFASILLGVRAQIQHLKAFATSRPLVQKLVDPRYWTVRFGSAPSVYELSGKWSADIAYGQKLKTMMEGIYTMAFGTHTTNEIATLQ